MDSTKISSISPNYTLPPETLKNRFEPFTFSKQFYRLNISNAIEQRTPACIGTALKIALAVPLYLVEIVARTAEAIGNAGIWTLNRLGGRSIEVVDPSKPDLPPAKTVYGEPILKADPHPEPAVCPGLDPEYIAKNKTSTLEKPLLAPKEADTTIVEEPAPAVETPIPTTTTLIETQSGEDKGGWEWDVNNPDQIHVRYPEPIVPSNKSRYLTTALGVIGLAAVAIPSLYYGYNYLTSSGDETPTHAWRLVGVMSEQSNLNTYGCMKTVCDGTFECVDDCPDDMIPKA